jgi:GTP cyclohydrolase I
MIERSLTASRGEAGVVELKKHLNLDITDDRAIESITPQQIAEAYKKMYTGSEKMPPEVRDLVNNMNNFQSSDFGFAKDVFREYRDITVQAKQ